MEQVGHHEDRQNIPDQISLEAIRQAAGHTEQGRSPPGRERNARAEPQRHPAFMQGHRIHDDHDEHEVFDPEFLAGQNELVALTQVIPKHRDDRHQHERHTDTNHFVIDVHQRPFIGTDTLVPKSARDLKLRDGGTADAENGRDDMSRDDDLIYIHIDNCNSWRTRPIGSVVHDEGCAHETMLNERFDVTL